MLIVVLGKRKWNCGYLLFWRTGLWRIAAYQDGRPIGMAIVPARPD
jgi:hypothetical protein